MFLLSDKLWFNNLSDFFLLNKKNWETTTNFHIKQDIVENNLEIRENVYS